MAFAQPLFLYLGAAAVVGLALVYWRAGRIRDKDLRRFAAAALLPKLTAGVSKTRRGFKQALVLLAVAALSVAMARPQAGFRWEETNRRGIDVLLAVDTSRSMLATDASPTRLERSKLGILDFLSNLDGDRVGLMPFAGEAFVMCPLTLDYSAFRQSVNALDVGAVPLPGTDIAAAIREARGAFDGDTNHKILVLITDGEELEGEAVAEAALAAKDGVTIHTIGVGTPAGVTIPLRDAGGRHRFVKDTDGSVVTSRLDERVLRAVANATGGVYEPLGAHAEGLARVYQQNLSLVPKQELAQRMRKIPLEKFSQFLWLAAALLLLETLLSSRVGSIRSHRTRSAPSRTLGTLQRTGRTALGALFLSATFLAATLAGPRVARADPAGSNPEDISPRAHYNRGAQAYQSGSYEVAAAEFRSTLGSNDLSHHHLAYYALGNTRYRQGQAIEKTDPKKTLKTWEEALNDYDGALQLDESDKDARFNRDFVQRRVDALRNQLDKQKPEEKDPQEKQQDPSESKQSPTDPQDPKQEDKGQEGEQHDGKQEPDSKQSPDGQQDPKQKDQGQDQGQQAQQKDGQQEPDPKQSPNGQQDPKQKDQDQGPSGEQKKSQADDESGQDQEPGPQDAQSERSTTPDTGRSEQPPTVARPEEAKQTPNGEAKARNAMPNKPREGDSGEQKAVLPGHMTQEEAEALLDALVDESGKLMLAAPRKGRDPNERPTKSRKDW